MTRRARPLDWDTQTERIIRAGGEKQRGCDKEVYNGDIGYIDDVTGSRLCRHHPQEPGLPGAELGPGRVLRPTGDASPF